MSFCSFCKSGTDHVLQRSMWSCGTHFNDPHWRTKECYKRELNEANERIKRLEEALLEVAPQLTRELDSANERIKRLKDRINRAATAFFRDGSDGQVASGMLAILEEGRNKP